MKRIIINVVGNASNASLWTSSIDDRRRRIYLKWVQNYSMTRKEISLVTFFKRLCKDMFLKRR